MASDQSRIKQLEELVGYLVLSAGNAGIHYPWRGDELELHKAVRECQAAEYPNSSDAQLASAAKSIRR
jgi:hypothetical protein